MTRFLSKYFANIGDGKLSKNEGKAGAFFLGFIIAVCFFAASYGANKGYESYRAENYTADEIFTLEIVESYNVRRIWDGRFYGTLWDHCGATLTADHVIKGMADNGEAIVGKPSVRNGGLIDAAHFGEWSCSKVERFSEGQPVSIIGYPGGSEKPAIRKGNVYIQRSVSGSDGYEVKTWVVVFSTDEPVVGGMSGGIVVNADGLPVGLLVVQNSPADINGDGQLEHSADIVALADYHEEVSK